MRAIVIGGGIGGLTAAIALRSRGVDAQVYERNTTLPELGAGIALWPNALKVLAKLGLGEALNSISVGNVDSALRRWNGFNISCLPAADFVGRFGGSMLVFHRAELLDLLAESAGIENIHLSRAFTRFDADADGVSVKFDDASSVRADVLVGADGIHSAVRSQLGRVDALRYSGYTAWRCVVPFDHSAVMPAESWGPGKRFGVFPVRGNRVYWFAVSNAPEGRRDGDKAPKEFLLSLFKGWHEPIEALIRAADDGAILHHDIYDRDPLTAWGQGRVTLLGDAAHPMTPNLGQGACQAIEDAFELASCLSAATSVETALKAYEARRIQRTTPIVLASRRIGAIGQLDSALLGRLRDFAFWLMPRGAMLRSVAPTVGYEGHLSGHSLN